MHVPPSFTRTKRARAFAAGCVALAAGGIVLLRAQGHGTTAASAAPLSLTNVLPSPAGETVPAPHLAFSGPHIRGTAALSQGAVQSGGERHVYAQVTVAGDGAGSSENRPVAMAVVLDTSGSMSGDKISQARNSVLELLNRMRDSDQIALVTYSDGMQLVQPLARVSEVRDRLRTVIPTISAGGGTMIPPALTLGASSLEGAQPGSVKRVVLVSDGQDGSGVGLPAISSQLRDRANGGVTLSSLGIGADFDERFMTTVADAGRGNYEALRTGSELAGFLTRELRQASSTAAERVVAEVTLPAGWQLARAYGAEAEGTTGTVRLPVGALSAGEERRVMLDLAVDARGADPGALSVAVSYTTGIDARAARLDGGRLALRTVATEAEALASRDMSVLAEGESAAASARQADALAAWNRGDQREAERLAQQNVVSLRTAAAAAPAPMAAALNAQAAAVTRDMGNFAQMSNSSEEGRMFGLRARAASRRNMQHSVSDFVAY